MSTGTNIIIPVPTPLTCKYKKYPYPLSACIYFLLIADFIHKYLNTNFFDIPI